MKRVYSANILTRHIQVFQKRLTRADLTVLAVFFGLIVALFVILSLSGRLK